MKIFGYIIESEYLTHKKTHIPVEYIKESSSTVTVQDANGNKRIFNKLSVYDGNKNRYYLPRNDTDGELRERIKTDGWRFTPRLSLNVGKYEVRYEEQLRREVNYKAFKENHFIIQHFADFNSKYDGREDVELLRAAKEAAAILRPFLKSETIKEN